MGMPVGDSLRLSVDKNVKNVVVRLKDVMNGLRQILEKKDVRPTLYGRWELWCLNSSEIGERLK